MTNVREAQLIDFEPIVRLREQLIIDIGSLSVPEYRLKVEGSGFLLPTELSREDFQHELHKYFVAEDESQHLSGYLKLEDHQELEEGEAINWCKPELEAAYLSKPHADIGGIAVDPQKAGRGIASAMLHIAEGRAVALGNTYLFAFVVSAPIKNLPSMSFHEKNGFERIAILKPETLFGIENYQSILYGKKIA